MVVGTVVDAVENAGEGSVVDAVGDSEVDSEAMMAATLELAMHNP